MTQLACAHSLPQQRCTNKQTDGMSGSEPWAEQPQGQQRCNRCTVRPLCQPTVHCAFNDNSLCQPIACCVFWDAKILRRHAAPDKSGQQCPSRHVANEPHDTPHHQREYLHMWFGQPLNRRHHCQHSPAKASYAKGRGTCRQGPLREVCANRLPVA